MDSGKGECLQFVQANSTARNDTSQMDSPDFFFFVCVCKQPLVHVAAIVGEKKTGNDSKNKRLREEKEREVFQGTAPRCSNLIISLEKRWSLHEILLGF